MTAPSPAPTSATPTKYAAISTNAPNSPPTTAAMSMRPVSLTPKSELAASAPRMNPKIARTVRNRR